MNDAWKRLDKRIDALALRERLLLLFSIMACCLAIADTVWLSPAQGAQKKLAAAVARENADLETLRTQLRTSAQSMPGGDQALAAREQIARTRDLIEQVNAEIVASSAQTDQANSLPKVLVPFLRRLEGLRLRCGAARRTRARGAGGRVVVLGRLVHGPPSYDSYSGCATRVVIRRVVRRPRGAASGSGRWVRASRPRTSTCVPRRTLPARDPWGLARSGSAPRAR